MDLASFLAEQVKQSSLRQVAEKTGISKSTVDHIIRRVNRNLPELETLNRIADAYDIALWRVIEMAGVDLGLPSGTTDLANRLVALASDRPEIEPIVQYLLRLLPDDLRGVVAYLEALDRQRVQ